MELELGAGDEVPDAESFLFFDLLLESLARESTRCLKPFMLLDLKTVRITDSKLDRYQDDSARLDVVQRYPNQI